MRDQCNGGIRIVDQRAKWQRWLVAIRIAIHGLKTITTLEVRLPDREYRMLPYWKRAPLPRA